MTKPRTPTSPRTRTPGKKAPASKPATAQQPATPARSPTPHPVPLDFERDFLLCRPLALALEAAAIRTYRGDPTRALQNVTVGLAAIAPFAERLRHEVPTLDLARITNLPSVARAVIWAAEQVERPLLSDGAPVASLRRAQAIRRVMLAAATSLAASGLLPAAEVDRIRAGRGPLDTATDCRRLADLFKKNAAALAGKTAVTPADVREAAEAGAELTDHLKRGRGRRARDLPAALAEQIDQRDRLWTLLTIGHRELRRAGMWLWVDEVDAHVPPLLAFDAPARRPAKPTPPPA